MLKFMAFCTVTKTRIDTEKTASKSVVQKQQKLHEI